MRAARFLFAITSICALKCLGQEPFLGPPPVAPAVGSATTQAQTSIAATWLDTSSRAAVQVSYNTTFAPLAATPFGFTGSVATCTPGTTAQAYQDAVLGQVNWFRAMGGVPALAGLNAVYNAKDQQAALMFSANGTISHTPPSTWTCYTAAGAEAASNSNVCYGFTSDPGCTKLYIQDHGASNSIAGHRRWILYPQTRQMGTGDVPFTGGNTSGNAMWVFDGNYGKARPATRDAPMLPGPHRATRRIKWCGRAGRFHIRQPISAPPPLR